MMWSRYEAANFGPFTAWHVGLDRDIVQLLHSLEFACDDDDDDGWMDGWKEDDG